MYNGKITEIQDELCAEVKLAGESLVTPDEIAVLFQGERRDVMCRTRDVVWSEWARNEYRRQTGAL